MTGTPNLAVDRAGRPVLRAFAHTGGSEPDADSIDSPDKEGETRMRSSSVTIPTSGVRAPVRLILMLIAVVGLLLGLVGMHSVGTASHGDSLSSHSEGHTSAVAPGATSASSAATSIQPATTMTAIGGISSNGVGGAEGSCGGVCDMHNLALAMACTMALLTAVLALHRGATTLRLPPLHAFVSTRIVWPAGIVRRTPSLTALSISRI